MATQTKFASGIIWSFLGRWGSKLIGLATTVILARLLTAEDFSIIALAMLCLGAVESFTQINTHMYLMRTDQKPYDVADATWTFNIIHSFIVCSVLAIGAPFAADFFHQAELENVIYCIAVIRLVEGFRSMGISLAQKELKFDLDFRFQIYPRFVYFAGVVIAALILKNYWALVIGHCLSIFSNVLLSYTMHEYRPKISWQHSRALLKFVGTTTLWGIGGYFRRRIDMIVIGRTADADTTGQYHLAKELANVVTIELIGPVIRGIVPNFSKLSHAGEHRRPFALATLIAGYIFFPVGFGLCAVSEPFIALMLGDKWADVVPMLEWLSLCGMMAGMYGFIAGELLIVLNEEGLASRLAWINAIVNTVTVLAAVYFFGSSAVPIGLLIGLCLCLPYALYAVAKAMQIEFIPLATGLLLPLFSAAAMYYFVSILPASEFAFLSLLFHATAGAAFYVITICILYLVRGKPEGTPEQLSLEYAGKAYVKFKNKVGKKDKGEAS